jgi:hypothetical protein
VRLFGNNPRYERWRWQILSIMWLAYAGFYLTRKSFAVAKVEMRGDDGLTCRKSARFRRAQSEKMVLQARPIDLES